MQSPAGSCRRARARAARTAGQPLHGSGHVSAQRLLAAKPGLALWAEVAVLAHLTGWLMPGRRRRRNG